MSYLAGEGINSVNRKALINVTSGPIGDIGQLRLTSLRTGRKPKDTKRFGV